MSKADPCFSGALKIRYRTTVDLFTYNPLCTSRPIHCRSEKERALKFRLHQKVCTLCSTATYNPADSVHGESDQQGIIQQFMGRNLTKETNK